MHQFTFNCEIGNPHSEILPAVRSLWSVSYTSCKYSHIFAKYYYFDYQVIAALPL